MFTITNTSQMPPCIISNEFDTWFDKFNTALRGIGLPTFHAFGANISITFSDEEETSVYGSLSIEELKNLILSKWGHNKYILDILQHINNYDDYRHSIQDLMGAIERIRLDNETLPSSSILHAYLEELQFYMPVMGRYTRGTRTITLFTKNIESAAKKHGNTLKQEFERVFIHELFHAYHYIDSYGKDRTELKCRIDYTSKVVKESLASAFEWNYCITNKITGYDSLHAAWRTYSVLSYPYSGASELLVALPTISSTAHIAHLDNKKFRDVFELSLTDMDEALRMMVPNDFYDIKNLMHYCERKVMSTDLRAAFDALMKQDLISVIAQREIPAIIRQKKNRRLIPQLMDLNYSNQHFHATQYPILATAPMLDSAGREKSYKDPVLRIGKTNYYLTAQWNKDHIDLLLNWIWQHR